MKTSFTPGALTPQPPLPTVGEGELSVVSPLPRTGRGAGGEGPLSGILNVDKPLGWTSHDVVGLVRRLTRQRQVGHAGTLDPLASGVLLVMVGQATRLSDYLMHGRKCYLARLRLGATTPTDDAEGEVTEARAVTGLTRERVAAALSAFRGDIEQVPPAYAAIKQGGVPVYKLARQGKEPVLAARRVRIDALALLALDGELLDILVWCGAGTYIRALARDVGQRLGCGAYLAGLRRLSSGAFGVDTAVGVQELRRLAGEGRVSKVLAPLDEAVAGWPAVITTAQQAQDVLHGNFIVDRLASRTNPFIADRSSAHASPGSAGVPPVPVDTPNEQDVRALETPASDRPRVDERSGVAMGSRNDGVDACLYGPDGVLLALARYDARRQGWQPTKVLVSPGASLSAATDAMTGTAAGTGEQA